MLVSCANARGLWMKSLERTRKWKVHVACTTPLTNSRMVLIFENFKIKRLIRKLLSDKLQDLTLKI